jgi:hypothetical protein
MPSIRLKNNKIKAIYQRPIFKREQRSSGYDKIRMLIDGYIYIQTNIYPQSPVYLTFDNNDNKYQTRINTNGKLIMERLYDNSIYILEPFIYKDDNIADFIVDNSKCGNRLDISIPPTSLIFGYC